MTFTLFLIILFVNTVVVNANAVNSDLSKDTINEIIDQAKKESGLEDNEFNLISNTDIGIMSDESEFTLQSIDVDEFGDVTSTAIIPYKILETGEMVDSFQYALDNNISPQATSTVPTTFVDVTITVITYYALYQTADYSLVYRHAGIESYWSSSNSTVSVSNMFVQYDTKGDLYAYPSVVDNGVINSSPLQLNYFKRSKINKSNPVKGTVYIDGNNTMPFNRVVFLSNYFEHGGLIYLKLNYVANGKSYVNDRSYYVYTK